MMIDLSLSLNTQTAREYCLPWAQVLGKELVRAKWNREASDKSWTNDKKRMIMRHLTCTTYRRVGSNWIRRGFGLNGTERKLDDIRCAH